MLGRKGSWGGGAQDQRLFIKAIFWIMGAGAPGPDPLPDFGGWSERWPSGPEPREGGLNTKAGLAVDSRGLPVRAIITPGIAADRAEAIAVIDGFSAQRLLADPGYDSGAIVNQAKFQGLEPVFPPEKSRRI